MFRKRKYLMAMILICLFALAGIIYFAKTQEEKPPLLVDGKPVTREELDFYNGDIILF